MELSFYSSSLPMLQNQVLVLILLIIQASAITYFRYSVVITQSDLSPGTSIDSGFKGESYRIYGTYASQAKSIDFTRNIFVKGNYSMSLYELSRSDASTPLLLPAVMSSPIQIFDNNTVTTDRYPFNIWIVTIDKLMPVYDAKSMNGLITTPSSTAYYGLTILSAEPFFNMHSFKMYTLSFMQFSTCGYDAFLNEYEVMKIESGLYGPSSFITLATPILTLYTESFHVYANFSFTFDKDNRFGVHNLNTSSTVSVVSPGWLNSSQSFSDYYTLAPFGNNSFNYNESRALIIRITASDFLPGENLLVQAGTRDDQTYQNWNINSQKEQSYQAYGNSVRVFLTSPSNNHTPRYRVKISSNVFRLSSLPIFIIVNIFILTNNIL